VTGDLLFPDVRAYGDEDGKAASYDRKAKATKRVESQPVSRRASAPRG
jgi:hypothetical protein